MEENTQNPLVRDKKGKFIPGHNAPGPGRPKGKTLKEFQAEIFRTMSDEQKADFLKDIEKYKRWTMAEGNPDNKTEETGTLKVLLLDKDLAEQYGIRTTQQADGSSQEPTQVQGS